MDRLGVMDKKYSHQSASLRIEVYSSWSFSSILKIINDKELIIPTASKLSRIRIIRFVSFDELIAN